MNRYAIVENGTVTNIAVADEPLSAGWVLNPPAQVQIGWKYDGSTFLAPLIYKISEAVITADGQPLTPFAGNYYCQPGQTVQLQGKIKDTNGDTVTSINVPVAVKMPLVRHANGKPTDIEIYLNVTFQNGVITAIGEIAGSGDWKILMERINAALQRISQELEGLGIEPFMFAEADITILA